MIINIMFWPYQERREIRAVDYVPRVGEEVVFNEGMFVVKQVVHNLDLHDGEPSTTVMLGSMSMFPNM